MFSPVVSLTVIGTVTIDVVAPHTLPSCAVTTPGDGDGFAVAVAVFVGVEAP